MRGDKPCISTFELISQWWRSKEKTFLEGELYLQLHKSFARMKLATDKPWWVRLNSYYGLVQRLRPEKHMWITPTEPFRSVNNSWLSVVMFVFFEVVWCFLFFCVSSRFSEIFGEKNKHNQLKPIPICSSIYILSLNKYQLYQSAVNQLSDPESTMNFAPLLMKSPDSHKRHVNPGWINPKRLMNYLG